MSVFRKLAILLTVGIVGWSFPVYATVQECPDGADAFENQETGSLLCVVLEGENAGLVVDPIVREESQVQDEGRERFSETDEAALDEASIVYIDPVEYTTEELNKADGIIEEYQQTESIFMSMAKGGFTLDGGIGWGVPSALDLRFSMGYMFASPNLESGFSLYLDFYGLINRPSYISLTLVPAYYFIAGTFRLTTGLGVGFLYYFNHYYNSSAHPIQEHSDDQKIFFMLKPTLLFDWFVKEDVFLGVGVEGSFSVEMQSDDKFHPHFNVFFHCGYKF